MAPGSAHCAFSLDLLEHTCQLHLSSTITILPVLHFALIRVIVCSLWAYLPIHIDFTRHFEILFPRWEKSSTFMHISLLFGTPLVWWSIINCCRFVRYYRGSSDRIAFDSLDIIIQGSSDRYYGSDPRPIQIEATKTIKSISNRSFEIDRSDRTDRSDHRSRHLAIIDLSAS